MISGFAATEIIVSRTFRHHLKGNAFPFRPDVEVIDELESK
jgi:hypothetical protein